MTTDTSTPLKATNTEPRDQQQTETDSPQMKDLVGSWERRVSLSGGIPDVARLASPISLSKKKVSKSNNGKKSTLQTMEDLSVFVSPREIRKKFIIAPKPSKPETNDINEASAGQNNEVDALLSPESDDDDDDDDDAAAAAGTPTSAKVLTVKYEDMIPKIGSMRDTMKAFERDHTKEHGAEYCVSQQPRGKRGSVLDRFTPMQTAKDVVPTMGSEAQESLPSLNIFEGDDEDIPEAESQPKVVDPTEVNQKSTKIDRDTLVLDEIRKMIRQVEDDEIEDEMDEEVKESLEKAAQQSPAYSKRWYDALTDSWIHCPSLATIILDFSLIELAEELYGEELPMVYTVSLRAVASEISEGEEELPDYVYRLAS